MGETYSLGAGAFSPYGYTFRFGDGSDPSAGFLDGEARARRAGQRRASFSANTPLMAAAPPGRL